MPHVCRPRSPRLYRLCSAERLLHEIRTFSQSTHNGRKYEQDSATSHYPHYVHAGYSSEDPRRAGIPWPFSAGIRVPDRIRLTIPVLMI